MRKRSSTGVFTAHTLNSTQLTSSEHRTRLQCSQRARTDCEHRPSRWFRCSQSTRLSRVTGSVCCRSVQLSLVRCEQTFTVDVRRRDPVSNPRDHCYAILAAELSHNSCSLTFTIPSISQRAGTCGHHAGQLCNSLVQTA